MGLPHQADIEFERWRPAADLQTGMMRKPLA